MSSDHKIPVVAYNRVFSLLSAEGKSDICSNQLIPHILFSCASVMHRPFDIGDRIIVSDSPGGEVPGVCMSWLVEGRCNQVAYIDICLTFR
jgi:hypothetical protein